MEPLKPMYMSLKEASIYSALSVPALRNHITSGELPCFKVGGKIIVRIDEFEAWIQQQRLNQGQDIKKVVDDVVSKFNV